MRTLVFYTLCIIVWFAVWSPLMATTYYFSSSEGSDDHTMEQAQSPDAPWQSLEKFNEIVVSLDPGDVVLFKRGDVFQGQMIVDVDGDEDAPIYIGAYGEGENPVISGLNEVTGWRSVGNGIYATSISFEYDRLDLLTIDQKNYPMGRWPNEQEADGGYLYFDSYEDNTITDDDLDHTIIDWTGGELVARKELWVIDRLPIIDHSNNVIEFDGTFSSGYNLNEEFGYFLQNSLHALDLFGEWFFDSESSELYIFFGETDPSDFVIEVPGTDRVVEVVGSHIRLEDLDIRGGNEYGVYSDAFDTQALIMNGCHVSLVGSDGISMISRAGFEFRNGRVDQSNNNGIVINFDCDDAVIANSVISDIGMSIGMGQNGDGNNIGILCKNDGTQILANQLQQIGYSGIDFGGNDVLVANNFVEDFCMVKADGGGIYSYNGIENIEYVNGVVRDNIVVNAGNGAIGTQTMNTQTSIYGIYLDDNTNHVEVYGNTVANCGEGGIFLHNNQHIVVYENHVMNNEAQIITQYDGKGNFTTDVIAYNNIFLSLYPMQLSALFESTRDDLTTIGDFYNNNYARPFKDDLMIRAEYTEGEEVKKNFQMDISEWQVNFGYGSGATSSPVQYSFYEILSVNTDNLIQQGDFEDSDLPETTCFSAYTDCNITWSDSHQLENGAAWIQSNTEVVFGNGNVNVSPDKRYILEFSAYTDASPLSVDITLRMTSFPWADVTIAESVLITNNVQNYEVFLPAADRATEVELVFYSTGMGQSYFMDNISLFEVDAHVYDPNDYVRLEYNNSFETKTISLDQGYIDVYENLYSGNLELQPFESIILLSTASNEYFLQLELADFQGIPGNCGVDLVWNSIQEFGFDQFILERSIDGVSFEQIGLVDKSNAKSYQFQDEEIEGDFYYRLKVMDPEGDELYSDTIFLSISCSETVDVEQMDLTKEGLEAIYINGKIQIEYNYSVDGNLVLYDQTGRVIRRLRANSTGNPQKVAMDVSSLPSGLYFLKHDQSSGAAKKISKTNF